MNIAHSSQYADTINCVLWGKYSLSIRWFMLTKRYEKSAIRYSVAFSSRSAWPPSINKEFFFSFFFWYFFAVVRYWIWCMPSTSHSWNTEIGSAPHCTPKRRTTRINSRKISRTNGNVATATVAAQPIEVMYGHYCALTITWQQLNLMRIATMNCKPPTRTRRISHRYMCMYIYRVWKRPKMY